MIGHGFVSTIAKVLVQRGNNHSSMTGLRYDLVPQGNLGVSRNIHSVQSYEAEVELRTLSTPQENMISAQNSTPIITIVQDSLLAAYLMTKENKPVTREQFMDISSKGERPDGTELWNPAKIKDIRSILKQQKQKPDVYNGRGLLSLLLPSDLHYDYHGLKIISGVIVDGTITKKVLGSSQTALTLILHKEYGTHVAANFIDNVQFVTNAWMLVHGFSVGLEDCMITSEKSVKSIEDNLVKCYTKAEGIEETTYNPGIREVRVTAALSQAKDVGMKIAKEAMSKTNNFLATVNSGAKGDFFNIAQITGLLGQQNLEGERVKPTLNHGKRTLPHYPFGEMDKAREYESRGFIKDSFSTGLNPQEFYFHAMSGREGVCDKSTVLQTAGCFLGSIAA